MGANPKREALMTSTKLDFVKPENKNKNIVTTNNTISSMEPYVRDSVIISITMDTGLSDIATFHDSVAAFSSGIRAEEATILQSSLLHSHGHGWLLRTTGRTSFELSSHLDNQAITVAMSVRCR